VHAVRGVSLTVGTGQTLGIAGENAYRVPSLSLPDARHLPPLERLQEFEAVQLFADRARLSQATFAVTPANALSVAQVCERLDGIPLALELAAARVKALPVEKLNERLDDMFRLLTGGSRTALPRQQTLRATIDWSYTLLDTAEQRQSAPAPVQASPLTPREREVAALVGRGLSNRAIARQLVITEATAERHIGNVFAKLGLASRTQAALWAVEHKLADPAS